MFVDFNILNQLGSPSINSNTFANRPAAGQTGRLFVSTDTYEIYRDNGTTWDLIGGPGSSTVTGTGAATQVAYWTAAQAIGGSNNLWWDNTNGFLGVGTAAPTTRIEAVKTDGIGIFANFTTNAGSGSGTTGIYSINNTASSGYAAVIEERTGNTTGGQYPLLVKHSLSAGTAAVGMGTGLQFQLPDDAGTFKTTQLTIETIDAAAATYKTRYRFNVQNNGSSTPVAYINSTGVGVFTATPSAALDIHSTGIIAVLNSTGSTNNGYLAFQRAGTGVWRIGDTYNGGSNFFELHNTTLATDALQVAAATNKTSWQATETYTTGLARGNYFDFNLSVAAGGSFSSPNAITALGASLDLTLAGNATIPSGARSGLDAYNTISFTGTGTLTHNQGTQIRAYSNVTAGWAFNGSATGTITHLAGLRALFPDNSGSAVTITNNYALLLNDQTANTGTVTYTNRWGVYQEGASDLNYMAANLLLGSTVNSGEKLQVTGNVKATGAIIAGGGNAPTLGFQLPNTSGVDTPRLTNDASNATVIRTGASGASVKINNFANSAELLTVTDSGNLGLGVTPSNWVNFKAIELPNVGFLAAAGNYIQIIANGVYNGTNYNYKTTAQATMYAQAVGEHQWFLAPTGTAGNTFSFTQAMTLDASGRLGIGTSTPGSILTVQQASTASTFGLRHTASGNGYGWQYATTGTTTNDLILNSEFNGSFTERVRITSAGYVGIGVNNPTFPLMVKVATNQNLRVSTETSTAVQAVNDAVNAFVNLKVDGSTLLLNSQSNGNVLIGTTTDNGYKLEVNGNAIINKSSGTPLLYFNTSTSGAATGQIIQESGVDKWAIGTSFGSGDQTFNIYNFSAAQRFLLISTGGNLEIPQGSIKTAAPTTGTAAAWKLGSRVAATVVVNTTEYIEVDIGGTLYKLATVT